MSKQLSGGPQTWDEPTFKVKGANITPDPDTGIGKWSDAEIKRALQEGMRPNGTPIAPIMPYGFYKIFTPNDLDAIVAYIKSVAAGEERGCGAGLQGRDARQRAARRREADVGSRHERSGEEAASISSPSAIAWNATRRW